MLSTETTVLSSAKFTFNKLDGGSKSISIPSPIDNLINAQLESFADYYTEAATIGGGVSFKQLYHDKTDRVIYKR